MGSGSAAVMETGPVSAARFAALMEPLGPFDPSPHVAVGVSGGADSLALALLAGDWARARGGRVTALTVDHGLRPEAAAEATQVAAWMAAAGVGHQTLLWSGPKPATGIQAAARTARLSLLEGWCRDHGVLDLLLAHHRDDQSETVLQRLGQGSGPDGLAAMAPVAVRRFIRLLRPLLPLPDAALRATLVARGQTWIEDPSNTKTVFQRVRLRRLAPSLADAGVTAVGLSLAAARAAERRAETTARVNRRLAESVSLDPRGFARVIVEPLVAPPDSEARAALGRLLTCVGGEDRSPREDALVRVLSHLRSEGKAPQKAAGVTLAHCWVLPDPHGAAGVRSWLVVREARHWPAPQAVGPTEHLWDGRFRLRLESPSFDGPASSAWVEPLARIGWAAVAAARRDAGLPVPPTDDLPVAARAALPVILPAPVESLSAACVARHIRYAETSPLTIRDLDPNIGDAGTAGESCRIRFAPRVPLMEAPGGVAQTGHALRLAMIGDDPI